MNNISIFLISNNNSLIKLISDNFEDKGIKAFASNEKDFLNAIEKNIPDIFLIDTDTETVKSIFICKKLHKEYPFKPQIILTKHKDAGYINKFIKIKDVDFVFKPINVNTLFIRIEKNTENTIKNPEIMNNGDLRINDNKKKAFFKQNNLDLTPKEYNLLKYLIMNKGKVLSREKILNHVWGYDSFVIDRNVDVYIGYLRDKLGKYSDKEIIITKPSFGYLMKNSSQ